MADHSNTPASVPLGLANGPEPDSSQNAMPAGPLPSIVDGPSQTSGGQQAANFTAGRDAAANDFAIASTRGGWQYDPDAMKKVISKLTDIRDGKLQDMALRTDRLVGIEPPGAEPVSEGYTGAANESGTSHNTQFERYRQYLDGYIQTLIRVDKAYRQQDEATLEAIRKLGLDDTDA